MQGIYVFVVFSWIFFGLILIDLIANISFTFCCIKANNNKNVVKWAKVFLGLTIFLAIVAIIFFILLTSVHNILSSVFSILCVVLSSINLYLVNKPNNNTRAKNVVQQNVKADKEDKEIDKIDKIKKYYDLYKQGAISKQEYEKIKKEQLAI